MGEEPEPVQRRIARSWEDVPVTVRDRVRVEADGDLRRVELIDRGDGDYSVTVHDRPMTLTPEGTIRAMGDADPRMTEVVQRVRPQHLSDWQHRRRRPAP